MVTEYLHPFTGYHGSDAVCHIRVYRPHGRVVIVATELPHNVGTSITNMAEWLAGDMWLEEGQADLEFVWIEHYLPRGGRPDRPQFGESFDRVVFDAGDATEVWVHGRIRRRIFEDPQWEPVPQMALEQLLGEAWVPLPASLTGH